MCLLGFNLQLLSCEAAGRCTYKHPSRVVDETEKLQRLRPARNAFRTELYEQIFQGQCVEITKGKVVEGSIESGASSLLLIDRRIEPPGFIAPLHDFRKLKK
jgi:hypothetical protein